MSHEGADTVSRILYRMSRFSTSSSPSVRISSQVDKILADKRECRSGPPATSDACPVCLCLQCFDAVGWAAGRASGL